jgi:hypothetical protein
MPWTISPKSGVVNYAKFGGITWKGSRNASKTEQNRAKQSKTEQNRAKQSKTEQNRDDSVIPRIN